MPQPRYRSRTMRRIAVTTPGGERKTHYERRKPSKAKCSMCGRVLPGVARGTPTQVKKMPKTARRPERPYGGVLCTQCMRKEMAKKAQ